MVEHKWFRRLWAVNGVLLFIFMAVILTTLALEWLNRNGHYEEAPVELASRDSGEATQARALRFDSPLEVYGTSTQLVRVRYGAATVDPEFFGVSGYMGSRSGPVQPVVNVLFLPDAGTPHLLFDRPAYVKEINRPVQQSDSLQHWIGYEVALQDTNGDGKLNQYDQRALMISDREGRNLRQVLSADWSVTWYRPFRQGHQLLISALASTANTATVAEDRRPQRAFIYDIETGEVRSYDAVDRLVDSAGGLLAR